MASSKQLAEARRQATRIHRGMGEDVRRFREDAAVTSRQLAEAAGIDPGYLRRIEDGKARASIDTYAKLALVLGSDLSSRMYPNTGPAIHDRHQARILEALISASHARWRPYPEVAVRHPSRGWIDVVLHDAGSRTVVATEIQSELRRLESCCDGSRRRSPRFPPGRAGHTLVTSPSARSSSSSGRRGQPG